MTNALSRAAGLALTLTFAACAARPAAPPTAATTSVATLPPAALRPTPPPAAGDELVVQGTVTYRQRVALPPQAVITVQLVDLAQADAAARVLVEQRLAAGDNQVPFGFSLRVPTAAIAPTARLGLQARIEVDGALRFISTGRTEVPRHGPKRPIEIVVTPAK